MNPERNYIKYRGKRTSTEVKADVPCVYRVRVCIKWFAWSRAIIPTNKPFIYYMVLSFDILRMNGAKIRDEFKRDINQ